MTLKLYGTPISGNVNPIMGLCAENGIPFELIPTNPMAGETKTPEFRKLNPMHCVPTIDDDGFTMYEGSCSRNHRKSLTILLLQVGK